VLPSDRQVADDRPTPSAPPRASIRRWRTAGRRGYPRTHSAGAPAETARIFRDRRLGVEAAQRTVALVLIHPDDVLGEGGVDVKRCSHRLWVGHDRMNGECRSVLRPAQIYPIDLGADCGRQRRTGDGAGREICGGDLSGDDGLLCRSDGDLSTITLRPPRVAVLKDFDSGLKNDRRELRNISRVFGC
jgi:hypothetical protein